MSDSSSVTTITVTNRFPELLDQLVAAPRDTPIVLNITSTTLPSFLFHTLVKTPFHQQKQQPAGAGSSNANSVLLGSSSSSTSDVASGNDISGRVIESTLNSIHDTAQLVGKISEMIFTHPAGCIACITKQQNQKQSANFFCSGPALAFACACAYRCVAPGVHFWFGDTCAGGLTPYGGLSHTLREWLGAGLAVPVLVQGLAVSASDIAARGLNCSVSDFPMTDARRVLFGGGGGGGPAASNSNSNSNSGAQNSSNAGAAITSNSGGAGGGGSVVTAAWKRLSDPAVRLSLSYGSIFSVVAWLRARKSQRVTSSIISQSRGLRGIPEKFALEMLIRERSVQPKSLRGVVQVEAITLKRILSTFDGAAPAQNPKTRMMLDGWQYRQVPLFFNVMRSYFLKPAEAIDAAATAPESSSSAPAASYSSSSSLPSAARERTLTASALSYDGSDPSELSAFLQRSFNQRGLPVKVYSLKQALNAVAIEAHAGSMVYNFSAPRRAAASAGGDDGNISFAVLLWDSPLYVNASFDATPLQRRESELRTRFFVPEVSCISDGPFTSKKVQTLQLVLNCLRQSSTRIVAAPVVERCDSSQHRGRLIGKLQGLKLFAALVRQALLITEDGAYPIETHKLLQVQGVTPTLYDRMDREGDTKSLLELVKALPAAESATAAQWGNVADASSKKRSGTELLGRMVATSRTDARFSHFVRKIESPRAGIAQEARLDDMPLHRMILSQAEEVQRPRRIVLDEEIMLRLCSIGAAFALTVPTGVMSTPGAERLAGAILGLPPHLGSSPTRYFALRQKASLESATKSSSSGGKKPNKNDSAGDEAPSTLRLDFASRLVRYTETLGPETIDAPPDKLVAILRGIKVAPTGSNMKAKL